MPLNIDWQQILLHLLNFTILAFGLYFLLFRPVKKIIDKREKEYKDRDEKTKSALSDAENNAKEYAVKIAEAEKEASSIKSDALLKAAELSDEKKASAERQAEEILSSARVKAEAERKKIVDGAGDDIKQIVSEISDKLAIGGSVSDAYDEFLSIAEQSGGKEHDGEAGDGND